MTMSCLLRLLRQRFIEQRCVLLVLLLSWLDTAVSLLVIMLRSCVQPSGYSRVRPLAASDDDLILS
jgi:hypothetical protein